MLSPVSANLRELDSVCLHVESLASAVEAYSTLFGFGPVVGEHVQVDSSSGDTIMEPAALFVLQNVTLELREAAAGTTGLGAMRFLASGLDAATAPSNGRLDEAVWRPREGGLEGAERRRVLLLDPAETGDQPIELVDRAWSTPPVDPTTPADQVHGLDHAVVRTRDADAARDLYEGRLGIRVAFDRSFEQWGTRLIMCKLGRHETIVEIASQLEPADDVPENARRDALWGFTWRVRDVEATHARLAAAGLDVSPVRRGRRPGTRVVTVRSSGTVGVPTLLIGPEQE